MEMVLDLPTPFSSSSGCQGPGIQGSWLWGMGLESKLNTTKLAILTKIQLLALIKCFYDCCKPLVYYLLLVSEKFDSDQCLPVTDVTTHIFGH